MPQSSLGTEPDKQLKVGSSVIVKEGIIDPDDGKNSIAGWCGRIKEIDGEGHILIAWDSITIKNMSIRQIKKYEKQGYSWEEMYLSFEDIVSCESRDLPDDADRVVAQIIKRHLKKYYY
ncbi:MAG: hypothetical protein PVG90_10680 [Bacillota bacterium]|jgi:hypothetical protein